MHRSIRPRALALTLLLGALVGCAIPPGQVETVPAAADEAALCAGDPIGPMIVMLEVQADLIRAMTTLDGRDLAIRWPRGYYAEFSPFQQVASPERDVLVSHGDQIWIVGDFGPNTDELWACDVFTEAPAAP